MLIDYSTGWVAPTVGEELRRILLLNLLPRPLLILWVQSDLALVHCPSINGTNLEGERKQTNKTSNTCAGVGGILVQYPACLYIRVLALRMHHCHYKSKIPL